MLRRPHRSFRLTHRRNYTRSLKLPGYIAFTNTVLKHLAKYKKVFLTGILVYSLLSAFLVGVADQDVFTQSADILKETSSSIFTGAWGEIGKGALLLTSIATGNFDDERTEVQQVYATLVFALIWLSTIWLIRAQLAGRQPLFRDALYNSSTPLVSTLLLLLLFAVQLIPAVVGLLIFEVGSASLSGVLAMLMVVVVVLLFVLSLYLLSSTFFALVVVTLPGMYPWRAMRTAGDIVIGRRIRILSRLLWGVTCTVVIWALIMVPVVMLVVWLQGAFKQVAVVPLVPMMLVLVSSAASVFLTAYIYMLYRKVVDDDANPA